jgi:hypothetical protein
MDVESDGISFGVFHEKRKRTPECIRVSLCDWLRSRLCIADERMRWFDQFLVWPQAGRHTAERPGKFDGHRDAVLIHKPGVDGINRQRWRNRIQTGAVHGSGVRKFCADRDTYGRGV